MPEMSNELREEIEKAKKVIQGEANAIGEIGQLKARCTALEDDNRTLKQMVTKLQNDMRDVKYNAGLN